VQQIARHLRSHPLAVRRPTTPPTVRARPGGSKGDPDAPSAGLGRRPEQRRRRRNGPRRRAGLGWAAHGRVVIGSLGRAHRSLAVRRHGLGMYSHRRTERLAYPAAMSLAAGSG
jgi:hypothetical protein